MEVEKTADTSWISATTKTSSWPVAGGSLDGAVAFESSISAVDSESDEPVYLKPKPPLILRRPSPDSGPCEITIHFAQQHEIRQVYVRSTARVYEIYYTADEKGGNEYLCTVRCGMAAQNEELLQETDAVGSLSTSSGGSIGFVDEGHSRTQSGSSMNEDGWVDVKVADSSGIDGGNRSLSDKDKGCMEPGSQELYEATAEISDADPVLSVTLRLLSIQSGDHVYISEVYVFADPVESAITDSSANTPVSSSGSALMSMLVPTLLQLSKSRMSPLGGQNGSAAGESRKHQHIEHKSTGAAIASSSNTFQTERMPSGMLNGAPVHMSQPGVPVETPNPQNRTSSTYAENNFACNHISKTLDELVSRVSRIEHFCLRFEENMLKPINSIEARLERVEQQLESFVKNPQFSRTACTRICAPNFSYSESESDTVHTDGNGYPGTRNSESVKKDDCYSQELAILSASASSSANAVQPSDMPSSDSASQLHPSLIVTAPDFSHVDDEDDNDATSAVKDSPKDSPKKPLSIDDALASALAGFLSSASTNSLKCDQMVEEVADLSINESALIQSDEPALPSVHVNGDNEISSIPIIVSGGAELDSHASDSVCEEVAEAFVGQDENFEQESSKKGLSCFVDDVPHLDKDKTEDSDLTTETGCREAYDDLSGAVVSDCSDIPALGDFSPSNDVSVSAVQVSECCVDSSAGEEVAKDLDLLQNIVKLPSPSMVDFEIPILDVKFSSLGNSSAKSPLEALLVDVSESRSEVLYVNEDNESSLSKQDGLFIIENEDSATSETSNDQLSCLDNHEFGFIPSNAEEEPYDPFKISNQDMCTSLI